ncbi:unnamed protein product [Caenorhabditis angaria]|uniref:Uncharacterized protein n=1 Tax=Caenorhabditis angaria TaxID=860376 RepID=A0A9P1N6J7_9PELO|nr:unnamed protein product [Caenorhabditis angaria]
MDIESAHLIVSARRALYLFASVPFVFTIIAIYISGHPHFAEVDRNKERTDFIRNNYQIFDNYNGTEFDLKQLNSIKESPFYRDNMSVYVFGIGNSSYCYERNTSITNQWSTSIFRASQLYSSVQTPIRYGLLLIMHPLLILAFVTVKIFVLENPSVFSIFVGISYFFNEIVLHISYYLLFTLHVHKDRKYIPYSTIYFTVAVLTTLTKFLLQNMMEGFRLTTILRFISILIITFCYPILKIDIEEYAENIYCDTFAPPIVTISQLICISIIALNIFHEIRKSKNLLVVITPSIDELEYKSNTHSTVLVRNYF